MRRTSILTLCCGLGLLAVAAVIYATAVSRVAAVLITPLGLGLLVVGDWSRRSERQAPRWAWTLLTVTALALVLLGSVSSIYSFLHPPTTI